MRVKFIFIIKTDAETSVFLWDQLDSNQRPIGYASHYCFRNFFRICELDYPFPRLGGSAV